MNRPHERTAASPMACGEETALPGVPSVGCVAALTYRGRTRGAVSACVLAASGAVYLLGPDLDPDPGCPPPREGLLSRLLWRPPAGRIHALVALLPATAADDETAETTAADDDAVLAFVAWSDARGRHRVAGLRFSLRRGLSGRVADRRVGLRCRPDVAALPPDEGVLRLFYDPALAAPAPSPRGNGGTEGDAVTGGNKGSGGRRRHGVVLCSCFARREGELATSPPSREGADAAANAPRQGDAAPRLTAGRRERPARAGRLRYLFFALLPPSVAGDREEETARWGGGAWLGRTVLVGPAPPGLIAPWLRRFRTDRPITAFAVVPHGGTGRGGEREGPSSEKYPLLRGAAGTVDGRVFVLEAERDRAIRQLTGPIADLCFVDIPPTGRGVRSARSHVIDRILNEAERGEGKHGNGNGEGRGGESLSVSTMTLPSLRGEFPGAGLALAVLSSAGSVVIMRAVHNELPLVQVVPDVLPGGKPLPSATVGPVEQVSVSTNSSIEAHLLRSFRVPKSEPAPTSASFSQPPGGCPPTSRTIADHLRREEGAVGPLLSRGLLAITPFESDSGAVELVVSTMGHAIVSIAFHAAENRFLIADSIITPAPMYFVGFVDFFSTGCADLVMASHSTVLVARRSREGLKEKASLLLRLLQARGLWPLKKATESVEI